MKEKLKEILKNLPDGKKEREKVYEKYGELIPGAYGWNVLCMTYTIPEKIESLWLPSSIKDNSVFQGMAGLVLDMGSSCFKSNLEKYKYWDKKPDLGDWVLMPRFDYVLLSFIGWPDEASDNLEVKNTEPLELRYVVDDRLLGPCKDPSRIGGAHILGK